MRCLLVADTELNGCCLSPQSPVSAEAFRRFNEPPTDDLPSVHSAFFLLVASRHSRSEALSTVAKTLSSNTSAIVSKESHGGARAGAGSAAEEFRSDRPAVISWRKNRREEGKEREEQRTVEEEKTKNGAPRGPAAVPCELEKGRRTVCHESQGRRGGGRPRLGGARPPLGRTAERGVRGWRKSAMWGWGVWVGGVKIGKGAGSGRARPMVSPERRIELWDGPPHDQPSQPPRTRRRGDWCPFWPQGCPPLHFTGSSDA